MKFIIISLAVLACVAVFIVPAQGAVALESPDQVCDANEEYMSCGASCPPTCESILNGGRDPKQHCPDQCVQGCFCKNGYTRDLKFTTKCVETARCGNPTASNDDSALNSKQPEQAGGGAFTLYSPLKWIVSFALLVIVFGLAA